MIGVGSYRVPLKRFYDIEALRIRIRIGFWGILCYNVNNKELQSIALLRTQASVYRTQARPPSWTIGKELLCSASACSGHLGWGMALVWLLPFSLLLNLARTRPALQGNSEAKVES